MHFFRQVSADHYNTCIVTVTTPALTSSQHFVVYCCCFWFLSYHSRLLCYVLSTCVCVCVCDPFSVRFRSCLGFCSRLRFEPLCVQLYQRLCITYSRLHLLRMLVPYSTICSTVTLFRSCTRCTRVFHCYLLESCSVLSKYVKFHRVGMTRVCVYVCSCVFNMPRSGKSCDFDCYQTSACVFVNLVIAYLLVILQLTNGKWLVDLLWIIYLMNCRLLFFLFFSISLFIYIHL